MPTTPKIKNPSDKEPTDPIGPLAEVNDDQSSPGSGEDDDGHGAADLQPEDVEDDDTDR